MHAISELRERCQPHHHWSHSIGCLDMCMNFPSVANAKSEGLPCNFLLGVNLLVALPFFFTSSRKEYRANVPHNSSAEKLEHACAC
eukprot:1475349-Amphidinium_carterae.1